ncbi:Stromal membrane-associated protein 2 [Seminavis robusta]|uniref:Stromal membrane-associated protein 2 n=1 Tax=Seminavis robusta TaxID=568900 RepID=A0A9N8DSB3_9STRA|nr:Stromal membrane-associated protein 2 [Seminavis robusta]|eukprot:Sro252_g099620.1 Stromal membrane-associated protein 2 (932) ;mRNA; r:33039-36093
MCVVTEGGNGGDKAETKQRLQLLLDHSSNKFCADCPDRSPQFVSLQQKPLVERGNLMGVFCCGPCARFHNELGEGVCVVKSIHVDFTLDQVQLLEQSGNQFVNSILEATLDENCKSTTDRATFIQRKYQDHQFFSKEVLHQKNAIRAKASRYATMMRAPAPTRTDRLLNRPPSNQNLQAVAAATERSRQTLARSQSASSLIVTGGRKGIASIRAKNMDGGGATRRRNRSSMDHTRDRRDDQTRRNGATVRNSTSDPFLVGMDASQDALESKPPAWRSSNSETGSKDARRPRRTDDFGYYSKFSGRKSSHRGYNEGCSDSEPDYSSERNPQKGKSMPRSSSKPELSSRGKGGRSPKKSSSSKWTIVKSSLRSKESRRGLLEAYTNSISDSEDEDGRKRYARSSPKREAKGSLSKWCIVQHTLLDESARRMFLQSYNSNDHDTSDSEEDREPRSTQSSRNQRQKECTSSNRRSSTGRSPRRSPDRSPTRRSANKDVLVEERKDRKSGRCSSKASSEDALDLSANLDWASCRVESNASLKQDRLAAILERPDNLRCCECSNMRPTWASFFRSPVDGSRLGVLCCFACHDLHHKVGDGEFRLITVRDVDEWTDSDLEALEISGNNVINAIYEANVTNEKDDRDKREHGHEAYFFEKYMNLSYFNGRVYDHVMSDALLRAVERKKAIEIEQQLHRSWDGLQRRQNQNHGEKPVDDEPNRRVTSASSGTVLELASRKHGEEEGDRRSSRKLSPKRETNRRGKRASSGNAPSELAEKECFSRKLSPKREPSSRRARSSSGTSLSRLGAKDKQRMEETRIRLEALTSENVCGKSRKSERAGRQISLDPHDENISTKRASSKGSRNNLDDSVGHYGGMNSSARRYGEGDRRAGERSPPRRDHVDSTRKSSSRRGKSKQKEDASKKWNNLLHSAVDPLLVG